MLIFIFNIQGELI